MLGRASSVMFYLVLSCRCSHPVVPVPKRSPMPNISKKQTHQTRKTRILLSTMSPVSMVLISIVADVAASFGRRRWRLCKLQRRSDLKKTCKPNANPMLGQCKANAKPQWLLNRSFQLFPVDSLASLLVLRSGCSRSKQSKARNQGWQINQGRQRPKVFLMLANAAAGKKTCQFSSILNVWGIQWFTWVPLPEALHSKLYVNTHDTWMGKQ